MSQETGIAGGGIGCCSKFVLGWLQEGFFWDSVGKQTAGEWQGPFPALIKIGTQI